MHWNGLSINLTSAILGGSKFRRSAFVSLGAAELRVPDVLSDVVSFVEALSGQQSVDLCSVSEGKSHRVVISLDCIGWDRDGSWDFRIIPNRKRERRVW